MRVGIIVLIVALVLLALIGLWFSGLLSISPPQEREIGRLTGQGSGDYLCPGEYNGIKVDRCSGFRYRIAFELWRYSIFQGYTLSRTQCQEYKQGGYQDFNTCREVITGAGQPGQYGTLSDSTFPLGFGPGETATFQGSGDIIYYENLIECPDGSYNYRSLCPKPITCADGSTVYDINKCPTTQQNQTTEDNTTEQPLKICNESETSGSVVCSGGGSVPLEVCQNNKWVPSTQECPHTTGVNLTNQSTGGTDGTQTDNTMLFIVIGILAIITLASIVYAILKMRG